MKTKALQIICLYVLDLVVSAHAADPKRYLFVWAGDADKKASDFLAVLDVTPHDPNYGRIVASVPVGAVGTIPHHTEYSLSDSGFLFEKRGHPHLFFPWMWVSCFSLLKESHQYVLSLPPQKSKKK